MGCIREFGKERVRRRNFSPSSTLFESRGNCRQDKKGSERERILLNHVDLSGIDLKPFRRLRNHLEHFDERLDNWVSQYDGNPFFDMNLVTGAKGFPKKAFLRALDARTYKFHGEDFDLDQLHNILLAIEQRLPR